MSGAEIFKTGYDREKCEVGVVHIGFGAFHRAHQAVYLDDYMDKSGDLRWGVAAINLRASDSAAFQTAQTPDGYVLKSISPDGREAFRLVRPHIAFVDAVADAAAATALFARPSVTLATVTVTESGYAFKDDGTIDLSAPDIAAELAGGRPRTIYGLLSEGLAQRAEASDAPISILCCDNVRGNGRILQRALLDYLSASHREDLAAWVRENATFPCSMVDRITPRSTRALRQEVEERRPGSAASAIHAEAFSQWVLENAFAGERPALETVGVQIVDDVEPYEEAKIRILNGGHAGLAYLAALSGHRTFDAAMRDATLRAHFDAWQEKDVLPGLSGLLPFDAEPYLAEIVRRFENPGIADQIERICMDGFSKMAIYVRPTLEACLARGLRPQAGYDSAASWVVFARKHAAGATDIPYHEPLWSRLAPMLAHGREHEIATDPDLWGDLPRRFERFAPDLIAAIHRMEEKWPD